MLRLALLLGLWASYPAAAAPCARNLALVGVHVYATPDSKLLRDQVIYIRGDRIEKIEARAADGAFEGYAVLERRGMVAVAGFWNSHVHLAADAFLKGAASDDQAISRQLAASFLRHGFTTVFDLASAMSVANDVRERIAARRVAGPRILTVGEPFYPPGGTPIYAKPIYERYQLPSAEIASTGQALTRVKAQIAAGADGIKLFTGAIVGEPVGVLPMSLEHARAIVAEAHRSRRPVFAHPTDRRGIEIAMQSGVDVLAHAAALMGPWSEAFAKDLASRRIALIPTLALYEIAPDAGTPIETALQQVKALSDAGGDILFGTDTGFIDADEIAREYVLLGKVLGWRQILASLTTAPAARFSDRRSAGRLKAGEMADIVLLGRDPGEGVDAFGAVRLTVARGQVVHGRRAEDPETCGHK
jgi:imidazolonepropionase-like amidohydrolase